MGDVPLPNFQWSAICNRDFTKFEDLSNPGSISTITGYRWDFGDGQSGSGKLATHVYAAPNQFYTATLTVFDLAGQFNSKSIQVYPNSN